MGSWFSYIKYMAHSGESCLQVRPTMDMSSDGCTRVQLGPTGGTCGRGSDSFSPTDVVAEESDNMEGCWDWYARNVGVAAEAWGVGCEEKYIGGWRGMGSQKGHIRMDSANPPHPHAMVIWHSFLVHKPHNQLKKGLLQGKHQLKPVGALIYP